MNTACHIISRHPVSDYDALRQEAAQLRGEAIGAAFAAAWFGALRAIDAVLVAAHRAIKTQLPKADGLALPRAQLPLGNPK
jgi:hypothetical protein